MCRKEGQFFRLQTIPWRISQHHIEAPVFKHLGELQRPMKELQLCREPNGQSFHLAVYMATLQISDELVVCGNRRIIKLCQRRKKCRCPDIAGGPIVPPGRFATPLLILLLLALNIRWRILNHFVYAVSAGGKLMNVPVDSAEGQVTTFTFFLVPFLECLRDLFVVAGYGREGRIGYAVLQHTRVEHADEAVAALDAVVEEAERLACPVSFQP